MPYKIATISDWQIYHHYKYKDYNILEFSFRAEVIMEIYKSVGSSKTYLALAYHCSEDQVLQVTHISSTS